MVHAYRLPKWKKFWRNQTEMDASAMKRQSDRMNFNVLKIFMNILSALKFSEDKLQLFLAEFWCLATTKTRKTPKSCWIWPKFFKMTSKFFVWIFTTFWRQNFENFQKVINGFLIILAINVSCLKALWMKSQLFLVGFLKTLPIWMFVK